MPSRTRGNLLVANRTLAILLFPEAMEPFFSFVGSHHVSVETLFKIAFPFQVVWICFPLNLPMPCNRQFHGFEQMDILFLISVEYIPSLGTLPIWGRVTR